MKCREFIYAGESDPQITEQEYPEFYLYFQKAVLASLEKQKLLTHLQYIRCIEEIDKQDI
ncbi:MAG: hypothetical protein OSJ62_13000 [Lachnospiraceae bacterium]|nr:hypothetical protein [Lachnospiraceae bacterium]